VLLQVAFQMVMRPASFDIANNPALLSRLKRLVDIVDSPSNPLKSQMPWLPSFSSLRKISASARLYGVIQKEVNKRKSSGIRRKDTLQQMLDDGESTVDIFGVRVRVVKTRDQGLTIPTAYARSLVSWSPCHGNYRYLFTHSTDRALN
jgi:hypothetical protein